ncbi:hypothetical protein M3J09_013062 [Ascochyta lentis]
MSIRQALTPHPPPEVAIPLLQPISHTPQRIQTRLALHIQRRTRVEAANLDLVQRQGSRQTGDLQVGDAFSRAFRDVRVGLYKRGGLRGGLKEHLAVDG